MTAVSDMKSFTAVRITRNCGRPSMKVVNVTRMEIAAEYAKAKTTHDAFPLGHKFGFASAIIKTAKFIALHDASKDSKTKQQNQSLVGLWGNYLFEETKKLKEPHTEPSIPFEETRKTQKKLSFLRLWGPIASP